MRIGFQQVMCQQADEWSKQSLSILEICFIIYTTLHNCICKFTWKPFETVALELVFFHSNRIFWFMSSSLLGAMLLVITVFFPRSCPKSVFTITRPFGLSVKPCYWQCTSNKFPKTAWICRLELPAFSTSWFLKHVDLMDCAYYESLQQRYTKKCMNINLNIQL